MPKCLYNFNRNFYQNGITSHKHAYICGFYITDGFCSKSKNMQICWKLKYLDHDLLKNILKTLEANHKIHFTAEKKQIGIKYAAKIALSGKNFGIDLNSLTRCNPGKKTYEISGLQHLENQYIASLILGIIDGDGSWCFRTTNNYGRYSLMIGSIRTQFLEWLQEVIFHHTNCLGRIEIYEKSCNKLVFNKQDFVYNISKWVYSGMESLDELFLERKYNRVKLIQYFYEKKLDPKERVRLMNAQKFNESVSESYELYRLSCMTKGIIQPVSQYQFAPSFHRNCYNIFI